MPKTNRAQVSIAYDAIRDQILSYALLPGAPLSDNQLSRELNMSRAPIREAVLLLQMDGLVQINEKGQPRVSPVCYDDISDILTVRCALEAEAIRIIARGSWLTEVQEQELVQIHQAYTSSAENLSEHYRYDDLFHQKLAEFSASPRISNILSQMRLQMLRARWLNLANPKRREDAIEEHTRLLSALQAHDEPEAVQALLDHLNNSRSAFYTVLNDKQMHALATAIRVFHSANDAPSTAEKK